MNDKQQLAAMGAQYRLTEEQAKGLAERMPQTGALQVIDDEPLCMAKRIEELEAHLEKLTNRLAWRNTGSPNGLRRFMTQKQYAAQTPGVQEWYEPIRYEVPEGWQLVPVGGDYFSRLVAAARLSSDKAKRKFPQPNYVLLKVAEEAGEVVQAGVHYAEGRKSWGELEGEMVQLLAMLIRLVTEGDLVNGIIPPDSVLAAAPSPDSAK